MKNNASAYNANDYDSRVCSVIPYYREFHAQIISLVRALGLERIKWLDTGCGTGNLAEKVLRELGAAELTLCDPSEGMLAESAQKLDGCGVQFVHAPTQELQFANEFDIVTAVQAHHYLDAETRAEATRRCWNALRPGGIYITFENIKMSSETSDMAARKRYARFLRENGKTEEETAAHLARFGSEVFPITAEQHLNLLRDCGFTSADILWTSYVQAGFWAIK